MAGAPMLHVASPNRRLLPLIPFSRHPSPPPLSPSSRRPAKITVSSSRPAAVYWTSANSDIDAHLALSLPKNPPPAAHDAMRRLISATAVPPRTMAPALCVAACELVGGRREHAVGAACAVQLMYSAFHAHRNLLGLPNPGGDEATAAMRDNIRLLAADGILPLSYELVAAGLEEEGGKGGDGVDPELLRRVMVEIADAMGPRGIVEGQYEEALCTARDRGGGTCEEGWFERACEKKEGSLYACGAACGAILGGAGEEATERLRRYGLYVGTMHGWLLYGGEKRSEVTAGLRSLALSTLEGLDVGEEDAILSLVDVLLSGEADT